MMETASVLTAGRRLKGSRVKSQGMSEWYVSCHSAKRDLVQLDLAVSSGAFTIQDMAKLY